MPPGRRRNREQCQILPGFKRHVWDEAVSLHGILELPEGMKSFVNDYQILLVKAGRSGCFPSPQTFSLTIVPDVLDAMTGQTASAPM